MQLVNTRADHIDGVVALQAKCFPPPFPAEFLWRPEHIAKHIEIFPEGQFVVLVGESDVVASATNLVIIEDAWATHGDWESTVGGHFLRNHDPNGTTLYGVDISVNPHYRRNGIARMLYKARFALAASLGLVRYGTSCRMPGYADSGQISPENYARAVERGELTDGTLTPLLKCGMTLITVIQDQMDDPESGNAGALLEWRCP